MNIKKFFAGSRYTTLVDTTFLLLRLVVGVAFMLHGWPKIQNAFSWMGPEAPVPGIFQALAALSEAGGGLALVLGLLTRLASLGIACTMAVAVMTHAFVKGDPFVSMTGGPSFEMALVFLCIALLFIAAGPGRFALDSKLFGQR